MKGMTMGYYRRNRINEEITKAMAEIIRNVKERSVRDVVLTVTGCDCAPDLSSAKIYYSFFGKGDRKEVAKGLKNATGYIRSQLARTLNLRQTPELIFIYDESVEKGAHIEKLLEQVRAEFTDDEDENGGEN